tara:strand:- start:1423 stop:3009 length:1587 start_codon:yes stop_codon:yes gene_type:complete
MITHAIDAKRLPDKTDVLIIGGGPNGLAMSGLLSELGITNVVVERKTELPRNPAAHVMRDRPVAILSLMGLGPALEKTTPDLALDYITWCTTLAGKEIGKIDFRSRPADLPADALYPWKNIPQNLLQPVLYAHATARPEATVALGVECIDIEDRRDGVVATLAFANSDEEQTINASWAIAADGAGSPVRDMLGIPMEGPGPFGQFYMIHFSAALQPVIKDRSGPIYWIHHPEAPGAFIIHEPDRSTVFMTPVFGTEGEDAGLPDRLAKALGAPIPFEIHAIRTWIAHGQIARHYKKGHAFLLGDAAHRFPPTGGLGLNTGIVEAHNLAWKLAMVIKGQAGEALLDTYEAECKPAAEANAADSMENQKRLGLIGAVLGWSSNLTQLEARIDGLTTDEKIKLADAIESQRSHFTFNGAMPLSDKSSGADALGPVISPYGAFRLYARSETPWRDAAAQLSARFGISINFHPLSDEDAPWSAGRALILMRPDGCVEWAATKPGEQSFHELHQVLAEFLHRGIADASQRSMTS